MKTCFVIIGYGEKRDPISNKLINLDKTYTNIIKPAFETQGYSCNRSIDLNKSGFINKRMIRDIFFSDFVVVDLTTFNPNVMYELGVRHALKPYSTILICDEDSMDNIPFNIQSLAIHPYQHLGNGIDFDEVVKQRAKLKEMIVTLEESNEQDSPVFDFIPNLQVFVKEDDELQDKFEAEFKKSTTSLGSRMELAEKAKDNKEFEKAIKLYEKLLKDAPNDSFLMKRLALVTYKAKVPTEKEALMRAKNILEGLNHHATADSETTGLVGAIYKRLYEITGDISDLEHSIKSYQKGYLLSEDYYNGINYAYMLHKKMEREEDEFTKKMIKHTSDQVKVDLIPIIKSKIEIEEDMEELGWLNLTMAEVKFDLGDDTMVKEILGYPEKYKLTKFQQDSFTEQITKKGFKLSEQ